MPEVNGKDVRTVVIACDAGMGSSVMVASQMRQRLKKYDVAVEHVAVNSIPADAQVVVCHASLAERARGIAPGAVVVPVPAVHGRSGIRAGRGGDPGRWRPCRLTGTPRRAVLVREAIRLAQHADDKWDALRQSGALLEELGAVDDGYAAAILEREGQISTYMGEGVAIPHGTDAGRALVRRTALGVPPVPRRGRLGRRDRLPVHPDRGQRRRARRRALGARRDPRRRATVRRRFARRPTSTTSWRC